MKYLLILFGWCLMACNRQSVKQEEKTDSNITPNERLEESIEIPDGSLTVSYTHLTLPTICSV